MISIAIILFFLPLIFRMLWAKKSFFFNIATTVYCYSAWYFVSYFLILVGIKFDAYLYIFALFPLALVLYETYRLVQNRRTISVDAKMIYLFLFMLVAIMVNLFTYKVFSDASTYIRFGIESKLNNTFAPTNSIYKYNSFYYIATTLGLFNVQYFYTIFVPLFIGVFMFLALLEIVKIGFPTIWKWYYVLPIAILVTFLANTEYAVDANWYTGSIIFLILLLWFVGELKNKNFSKYDILIVFFIFFLSNFSLTAIVVGLPIWLSSMIFLFFFRKVALRSLLFTPLVIFEMIITFMPMNANHYTLIMFTLCFASIFSVALLVFLFWKHAQKQVGFVKTNNWGNGVANALALRKNRIYFLYWFTSIYMILMVLIFTLKGHFGGVNTSHGNVYNIIYFLLMFISFGIFVMSSRYEFFVYVIATWIIFAIYSVLATIAPNLIPNYLSSRIFFAFNSCILLIVLVFVFELIESHKKLSFTIVFFPLLFFSGINLNTPFNPIFGSNIRLNNTQTTRKNFDFLMENYQEYFASGEPIFSEIDTAFITDFNFSDHNYLQSTIGKLYVARNYAEKSNRSPFNFLDKHNVDDHVDLANFIDENLKNPGYFRTLILRDATKLVDEYQLDQNYTRVKDNGEISIWSLTIIVRGTI